MFIHIQTSLLGLITQFVKTSHIPHEYRQIEHAPKLYLIFAKRKQKWHLSPCKIENKKEEEGAITQIILPFITPGATPISSMVSVVCEDDEWTYFYGGNPVYTHQVNDQKTFRFITAQLVVSGACRQVNSTVREMGLTVSSRLAMLALVN